MKNRLASTKARIRTQSQETGSRKSLDVETDFPGSKQPVLYDSVSCKMPTVYKALHWVQGSTLVVLSPFTADPEAQRS